MDKEAKPFSAEELAQRREVVTESLAAWMKEKPVSHEHSYRVVASIDRYEMERRYLATIDRQAAQLAVAVKALRKIDLHAPSCNATCGDWCPVRIASEALAAIEKENA